MGPQGQGGRAGHELRADGGGNDCVLKEKLIHSDDTNIELVLDCLTM